MTDPLSQLRLRFTELQRLRETRTAQVYTGRDYSGYDVTLALLTRAAAGETSVRRAFVEAAERYTATSGSAVQADVHAAQPWLAARHPDGPTVVNNLVAELDRTAPGPATATEEPSAPEAPAEAPVQVPVEATADAVLSPDPPPPDPLPVRPDPTLTPLPAPPEALPLAGDDPMLLPPDESPASPPADEGESAGQRSPEPPPSFPPARPAPGRRRPAREQRSRPETGRSRPAPERSRPAPERSPERSREQSPERSPERSRDRPAREISPMAIVIGTVVGMMVLAACCSSALQSGF